MIIWKSIAPRTRKSAIIMALVNSIMAAGVLHAQSAPPVGTASPAGSPPPTGTSASNPTVLPEMTVTDQAQVQTVPLDKYTQPLGDTPQSIDVVGRQMMDEQGSTTLHDALRNVAGISLAAGEGGSQGDNLTLRGFTARNDIYIDGIRDFGSYYRDPFDLQEVEVLKGPSSAIFGRGSTGGVINQESKVPQLQPFVAGGLTLGTDATRRATTDVDELLSAPDLGDAFRLNLMGDEGGTADRNVSENRRFGAAPSLAFGLGTPTQLSFSYFHQTEDDVPDYGLPWYFNRPAPVARDNFYGFTDDYLRTYVDVASFKAVHKASDALTLSNQARFAHYGRDFRITEPQILNPPYNPSTPLSGITINRNELSGVSVESLLDDQADATIHFETAGVAHALVTGVEVARETSDPTRYAFTGVPGTSLLAPNEHQAFSGTATVSSEVDTTANTVAGYAIDTAALNRQWTLVGGFRWERFAADYTQAVAPASAFDQVEDMPSWRGAIVYKPAPNGSIYVDAGNSYDPSAETLSLSAANANTPPEKNLTYEVGTKWDFLERKLSVRTAVYRTEKTNAREPDPTDSALNVLGGDQRVDGFEGEVSRYLTDSWEMNASYALMDSAVVSSQYYPGAVGAELANVPRQTFTAWTAYSFPWRLKLGGGGQYVAPRTASSTVPDDPTTGLLKEVPGYWVFNAMASYPISLHFNLQLNVNNLANRTYYDELHPAHIVMGPGRSAQLSLNFHY